MAAPSNRERISPIISPAMAPEERPPESDVLATELVLPGAVLRTRVDSVSECKSLVTIPCIVVAAIGKIMSNVKVQLPKNYF